MAEANHNSGLNKPRVDKNSPQYKAQVLKVLIITFGLGLIGSSCLAYRIHRAETASSGTSVEQVEQSPSVPTSP